MSQQNNSSKSQVWWSWPGGIGWPTPIPLKGGGDNANLAGNVLPPGFKINEQGVVAPPITVFNGGKRSGTKQSGTKRSGRKSRRNGCAMRKNRKNTRKNRKANRKTRRNNRK